MRLKIMGIEDIGNIQKERVVLRVLEDTDVGQYAIFKSNKSSETSVSSRVSETFWFQDQEVKKDDLVVIYTKAGSYKVSKNQSNNSHFFYWDKSSSIWGEPDDALVLLNINEWTFKTAD